MANDQTVEYIDFPYDADDHPVILDSFSRVFGAVKRRLAKSIPGYGLNAFIDLQWTEAVTEAEAKMKGDARIAITGANPDHVKAVLDAWTAFEETHEI